MNETNFNFSSSLPEVEVEVVRMRGELKGRREKNVVDARFVVHDRAYECCEKKNGKNFFNRHRNHLLMGEFVDW